MSSRRLLPLFFASGIAALVYEACWLELLASELSHSTRALAVVLGAYLVGLAAGAAAIVRRPAACRRPLRWYAGLEAAVAVAAAVLPFALRGVARWPAAFLSADGAHALRLVGCGLLLAAVTALLGATFPLQVLALARAGMRRAHAAGWLLAVQTVGGALGVLAAGFWGIPRLGYAVCGGGAVLITVLVALVAAVLARGEGPQDAGESREAPARPSASPSPAAGPSASTLPAPVLLVAAGAIGGGSLAFEVLATRILGHFLPNLAMSFSAMLAVYLLALAAGSALAAVLPSRRGTALLVGAAVLAGGALALSIGVVGALNDVAWNFQEHRGGGYRAGPFVLAALGASALLVFLPAMLMATFLPLAVGEAARSQDLARACGRLYAANTLGAALGAMAAGTVLVPWFGLKGAVLALAVGVSLVAAGLAVASGAWRRPLGGLGLVAMLGALALSATRLEVTRPVLLDTAIFRGRSAAAAQRVLIDHRPGAAASVSVVGLGDERALYTDAFFAAGTAPEYRYMKMLGHLPMLRARAAKDAVVIMFGTGSTAGAVARHPGLERLHLVELCPEVLEVAGHFEAVNFGLPEQGPAGVELTVAVDDGRAWLRRDRGRHDVITLEPLLPDSPGGAPFYTLEFLELARGRLAEGGVLCHWIPLHAQEPAVFDSLLATFAAAFEAGEVHVFEHSAVLLGFAETRAPLDWPSFEQRASEEAVAEDLRRLDLEAPALALGGYVCELATVRRALEGSRLLHDDHPFVLYPKMEPRIEHWRHEAAVLRRLEGLAERGPPGLEQAPSAVRITVEVARRLARERRAALVLDLEARYAAVQESRP